MEELTDTEVALQLYLELSAKEAACEIMSTGKSESLESEVQRRKNS